MLGPRGFGALSQFVHCFCFFCGLFVGGGGGGGVVEVDAFWKTWLSRASLPSRAFTLNLENLSPKPSPKSRFERILEQCNDGRTPKCWLSNLGRLGRCLRL